MSDTGHERKPERRCALDPTPSPALPLPPEHGACLSAGWVVRLEWALAAVCLCPQLLPSFWPRVEKAMGPPVQGAVTLPPAPLSQNTLSWDVSSLGVSTGRSDFMFSAVRASALGFAHGPAQVADMAVLYRMACPDGLLPPASRTPVFTAALLTLAAVEAAQVSVDGGMDKKTYTHALYRKEWWTDTFHRLEGPYQRAKPTTKNHMFCESTEDVSGRSRSMQTGRLVVAEPGGSRLSCHVLKYRH